MNFLEMSNPTREFIVTLTVSAMVVMVVQFFWWMIRSRYITSDANANQETMISSLCAKSFPCKVHANSCQIYKARKLALKFKIPVSM